MRELGGPRTARKGRTAFSVHPMMLPCVTSCMFLRYHRGYASFFFIVDDRIYGIRHVHAYSPGTFACPPFPVPPFRPLTFFCPLDLTRVFRGRAVAFRRGQLFHVRGDRG